MPTRVHAARGRRRRHERVLVRQPHDPLSGHGRRARAAPARSTESQATPSSATRRNWRARPRPARWRRTSRRSGRALGDAPVRVGKRENRRDVSPQRWRPHWLLAIASVGYRRLSDAAANMGSMYADTGYRLVVRTERRDRPASRAGPGRDGVQPLSRARRLRHGAARVASPNPRGVQHAERHGSRLRPVRCPARRRAPSLRTR
jgi:hypothetical protein